MYESGGRLARLGLLPRLGLLVAISLVAGCATSPVFSSDQRLEIEYPTELQLVSVPFDIRWSVADASDAPTTQYAVFVDRDPLAPGESLSKLVDDQCAQRPDCPDERYYADRLVYLGSGSGVTITDLFPVGGTGGRSPHPVHRATVIPVNGDGERIGEAQWTVEFREAAGA